MQFPNISPTAFSIGGFELRWYALAYIFGFVFAFAWIRRALRKTADYSLSYKDLDDLTAYGVFGVLIGGRLGYALFYNPSFFAAHPFEILKVWSGGMSFHGGFVGAIVAIMLFVRKKNQNLARLFDLFAVAAPIGLFLGRLANFVNAELYGRPTASAIGIVFPNSDGLPRHPSQLYEAAFEGVFLFALMNLVFRTRFAKSHPGFLSSLFLLGYGFSRFFVELFREPDAQIGYIHGLTMGQILSSPIVIGGIVGIVWRTRKRKEMSRFATSPLLNGVPFATHRFFTRNGGVSKGTYATANCKFESGDVRENVSDNRRRLLATIGANADTSLFTVNQKHTAKVVVIDDESAQPNDFLNIEADAIIATKPNLVIGVLTADCVPVLIADPVKKIVAAVHCGWQGIFADIPAAVIEKLKVLGSDPADLLVSLGPSLKRKSYEVSADFAAKDAKDAEKYIKNSHFDCTAYCRAKWESAGVPSKNIEELNIDTLANDDSFFSYRRSVLTGDFANGNPLDSGRQLSVIAIS